MDFYIVDAFTDKAFGGNTAGVVLYDNLQKSLMQKIAAELRFSETAFVKKVSKNLFSIRYFTPNSEIELCGHATIAAFKVLLEMGMTDKNHIYEIETLSGILPVYIEENFIFMEAGIAKYGQSFDEELLNRLCSVMGSSLADIGDCTYNLKPEIVSTGLYDIMLPIKNNSVLKGLNPNYKALSELCSELGVVGVHAFCLEQGEFTASCRNFAPLYGIDEESATGTSNASLTYYLYNKGVINSLKSAYMFSQGETLDRPSVITTKLLGTDPVKILVGGNACIVSSGKMHL